MLETLKIQNMVVIDEVEIPFKKGLNILSGETGAGKSIVLNAISLLLGSRASADLIRTGCDEASVEGLFDVSEIPWVRRRMEELGFPDGGPEGGDDLLIRRVIHRNGKSRIYINGQLATLSILQQLAEGLVDLCGQHEHQSLMKPQVQIELLDRYGGLLERAEAVSEAFEAVRYLNEELRNLEGGDDGRAKRLDYLRFQIQELEEAELKPREDEGLQEEKKLLQSAAGRIRMAEEARRNLEEEDLGALDRGRAASSALERLSDLDGSLEVYRESLNHAIAELEEAAIGINRYLESVDLSPERLEWIQERLARIASLRRKYGSTVEEMMKTLEGLKGELSVLEHQSERAVEIEAELEKARAELHRLGTALSQARSKVSKLLSDSVTKELQDLRMESARFQIRLTEKSDLDKWTASGGADTVEYLIEPNPGEAAKPLSRVASGGELSRVMLAIRRVIADRGGIGVYLFDEIDAGMGGQTAFEVGRKLKSVSRHNQVICITHLPQVASFADHHLVVRKHASGKRTVTDVVTLKRDERKGEIARMLGGASVTPAGLRNADDLIRSAVQAASADSI